MSTVKPHWIFDFDEMIGNATRAVKNVMDKYQFMRPVRCPLYFCCIFSLLTRCSFICVSLSFVKRGGLHRGFSADSPTLPRHNTVDLGTAQSLTLATETQKRGNKRQSDSILYGQTKRVHLADGGCTRKD